MTQRRLLLFDIDGTLLKTAGAGRNATRDAMLEVFGTASTVDSHHFGGKTDWYTLATLLSPYGYDAAAVGERMADFVDAMGRHIAHHIQAHPAHALPGALHAVTTLRDDPHSLIGIVTGNAPTSAAVKLRSAGFDPDWFAVGAYGSESIRREDLPRLAQDRAAALTGAPFPPQRCIVIGDTVMDVAAARANAMRVIAVRTGFEDPAALRDSAPDHLLDDLSGLLHLLAQDAV